MEVLFTVGLFAVGLALVLYFAEKLVQGAVATAAGFGVPVFVISVIFIGFDPENLAVGAVGSFEGSSGIALGSVVGAAMVAVAFALGLTALIVPLSFGQAPKRILAVPVLAVLLFGVLAWDGSLSRLDGGILLGAFLLAVGGLLWMGRRGLTIEPAGEVAETLGQAGRLSKWKALGLLVVSLAAIVIGSEMLVTASQTVMGWFGLSATVFGMTVLAFAVSVEEIARELPAALKGRPDITFGNIVGSVLAFFCFNAGVIALVRPVSIEPPVWTFYYPVCAVTVAAVSLCMLLKRIPRWAGAILVLLYLGFVLGGSSVSGATWLTR
jgi:cation:H+ antiporter